MWLFYWDSQGSKGLWNKDVWGREVRCDSVTCESKCICCIFQHDMWWHSQLNIYLKKTKQTPGQPKSRSLKTALQLVILVIQVSNHEDWWLRIEDSLTLWAWPPHKLFANLPHVCSASLLVVVPTHLHWRMLVSGSLTHYTSGSGNLSSHDDIKSSYQSW